MKVLRTTSLAGFVDICQGGGPWETGSGLRRRKGECERSVALRGVGR
jgi:hypothetical protein